MGLPERLHAVHSGQPEVQEHDFKSLPWSLLKASSPFSAGSILGLAIETLGHDPSDVLFVIHDENRSRLHATFSGS